MSGNARRELTNSAPDPSAGAAATRRDAPGTDDTVETQHGSRARFHSFMRQRVSTLGPRTAGDPAGGPPPLPAPAPTHGPGGAARVDPSFRQILLGEYRNRLQHQ